MDYVQSLKSLVVVLSIAILVFAITKPISLSYMDEPDWHRRRNVWIAVTFAAFLSPSFWIYAPILVLITYRAAKSESNPLALWMLIVFSVPPDKYELPRLLDIGLLELNHFRVLTLSVILPLAVSIYAKRKIDGCTEFKLLDLFLLAYLTLKLIVIFPYTSITNILRVLIGDILDIVLVYYVVSRTSTGKRQLVELLACFTLSLAIIGPIGMFESVKTWLLYDVIPNNWQARESFAFLLRGDTLRARASTNHALSLGILSGLAFGFWLYLISAVKNKIVIIIGSLWFWIGLIAAYSRGPWIFAFIILYTYLLISPGNYKNLVKISVFIGVIFSMILLTTFGAKIIDSLPFIGTIDADNITYRQRLIEKSWEILQDNPIMGDPLFLNRMEELRQGQGIVDVVNGYLSIALQTGFLGVLLFFGPMIYTFLIVCKHCLTSKKIEKDLKNLSAAIAACFFGLFFSIGSSGMDHTIFIWFGILAGLRVLLNQETERKNYFIGKEAR